MDSINSFYDRRVEARNFDPTMPIDLVTEKLRKLYPELIEEYGENNVNYSIRDVVFEPRNAKRLLWTIHRSNDLHSQLLDKARLELFNERKFAFLSIASRKNSIMPTVVFVAMSPSFMIVRESIALRAKGYKTCLLAVNPIYPNLREQMDSAFDATLDGFESISAITEVVREAQPSVFHILCCMFEYHLVPSVIENSGNAICICEFYDVTSPYLPHDKLSLLLPKAEHAQEMVTLDLEMEHYIFRHADAIISRLGRDLIQKVKISHDSDIEVLQFNAYPLPKPNAVRSNKYSAKTGKYHLVHAGNVHPNTLPKEITPIGLMADTFRNIIEQGIYIDVLQDPNRPISLTDPDYAHYIELTKSPLFNFKNGVAPDKLDEALSRYDYGLNLSDFDPEAEINLKECIRDGMGTKQFTYIEAGIPSIICAEYKYSTDHLLMHGYGVSVDASERKKLRKILDETNYQSLIANIAVFNDDYNMINMIDEVIQLYKKYI